jgi:uncharacterized protein (UPF0276 family)
VGVLVSRHSGGNGIVSSFLHRIKDQARLGLGISTEYGASQASGALDVHEAHRREPQFTQFLEVGVEASKGLDDDAKMWSAAGLPTTFHFLDINLDEPEDFDSEWLNRVRELAEVLDPAWMCGDAGLWHFGPRDRGHMLLLPPILTDSAASAMAEGIVHLSSETGLMVLPENPPGHVFIGDHHLLDFFAKVTERADTGMLLDCAHLAIYQKQQGETPLAGFDAFPFERIVELHVAGGTSHAHEGYAYIEDDHTPDVLPDTWLIFEEVLKRASNLKAVVFECERNTLENSLPGFERIEKALVEFAGWKR